MNYSHTFGSNFPESLIPVGTKRDVDGLVVNLVAQINKYMDAGDIVNASKIFNDNKEVLEPYCDSAAYHNRIQEEIYNTGLFALSESSYIVSDTEPSNQGVDSFWLQSY